MSNILQYPAQNLYAFVDLAFPVGIKVLMSILCGGLIGIERELKSKPAGIKTNILICLGATLYSEISILNSQTFIGDGYHGDPSRVAAQIVSGIGFLGAGAILQSRASVVGLTTAATMWVVAAIGTCIGCGYPLVAFIFTMTVLFTLLAIDRIENRFLSRSGTKAVEIIFDDVDGSVRSAIDQVMTQNQIALDDFDIRTVGQTTTLHMQYSVATATHKRFILGLWTIKGIKEVRQV